MLQGTFTALVTPFRADENFDEAAFARLIEEQIAAGIEGVVPVGTTGESPTVTHAENIDIIVAAIKAAAGRTKVIAGTGSNSTREAICMTEKAAAAGADAALLVAPYYNRPSQEGLYRHFLAIAKTVPGLPLVIYNVPGRTGVRIETETILRLAENPSFVALKDATGNLDMVRSLKGRLPAEFTILSGDDALTLAMIREGGQGVISVASNLFPAKVKALTDAALSGDFATAERLHAELADFFAACFCESNPVPIKTMLALAGKCEEVFRLPLCELSPQNRERVKAFV